MTYPFRPVSFSAVALLFALAACGGDSIGPIVGTRISISVDSIDGPILFEDVPGEPRIRCAVTFRASASGGESAYWHDATFRFFAGPDRATPVDSTLISAASIWGSWGGQTLRNGQSAESNWVFESGAPFVVTATYRYSPSGTASVTTANTRFACGPEPSANSPLPTITNLSLTIPSDGLEPGDVLSVSYTAHAPLGVWATAIELSGACNKLVEFGERLETTASRTRSVQVPKGCAINAPLTVTVHAVDAALRLASEPSAGPILVDHTPPTLDVLFFPPNGGSLSTDIAGIFFVGDTIDMVVFPSDNHLVRSVEYEIVPSGVRRTIDVSPTFDGRVRVGLPPEAVGPVQLRVTARDVQGLTSLPYLTRPDSIQVYPNVERPTLPTALNGRAQDVAIDPERGAIYIAQLNEWRILVLSATTLQITRTIPLPGAPTSLDFTPGGDSLVFTHGTGLGIVDLSPSTPVLSNIPIPLDATVFQRPTRVVVLANGKAYVALGGSAPRANQLLELDLATGEHRVRADAADADGVAVASSMQRSPDRTAFIFNGGPGQLRRYDVTTDRFTLGGSAIPYGSGFSLDRGGQHNALVLNLYDASLAFVRRVQSIYGETNLVPPTAISADGEYLYVAGRGGIMRSRVSDGRLVDRTRNPVPADIIRVASDDSFIVTVSVYGASQIGIIRMR